MSTNRGHHITVRAVCGAAAECYRRARSWCAFCDYIGHALRGHKYAGLNLMGYNYIENETNEHARVMHCNADTHACFDVGTKVYTHVYTRV